MPVPPKVARWVAVLRNCVAAFGGGAIKRAWWAVGLSQDEIKVATRVLDLVCQKLAKQQDSEA